jgi:hypothetical protein
MPYPENRKQNHKWKVILYHDCSKREIAKIYTLDTIKQISYILDIETYHISNYYHGLSSAKKNLKLIDLVKI